MVWLQRTARVLLIPWAAFWIWFNVASGFGELAGTGRGALVYHLIFALVIAAAVLLAWRRELAGGVALLIVAGLGQWLFHPHTPLMLTLTVPPAVASGLLLLHRWLGGPQSNLRLAS